MFKSMTDKSKIKKYILLLCCGLILSLSVCSLIIGKELPLNKQVVFDSADSIISDLELENFTLRKGSYTLVIDYETDTDSNVISLICPDGAFEAIQAADNITLYSNKNIITTSIQINDTKDCFQFKINYADTGFLNINRLYIYHNMNKAICSCCIILLMTLILFLIFTFKYWNISVTNKETCFILFTINFITCIPLFTNYLFYYNDLIFHLLRIEGIKDGILSGNFPVRIQPTWLNGYGYASSIMYGDIFLYIPAFLRILGFSIQNAYKFYVILINTATCFVTYWCINKIFKDSSIGLIGSLVYTMAPYRFTDIYIRSAIGEYTAMTFLPLIICGLYYIIGHDSTIKDIKQGIIIATIGFSGIIQTHVLTCELVGGITILAFIFLWKRILDKKILIALCQTVMLTILINMWWLVPFFDYMQEELNVSLHPYYIQKHGTFLAQLLMPIQDVDSAPWSAGHGIPGELPQNIGLSFCLAIFAFFYLIIQRKTLKNKKYYKFCLLITSLGCIALYATTIYFPYDKLMDIHLIFYKLFGTIQFPWRFLSIATVLLLFSLCAVVAISKNNFVVQRINILFATIILCTLLPYAHFVYSLLDSSEPFRIYDIGGLNTTAVVGGEYLPINTDISILKENKFISSNETILLNYNKHNLNIDLEVANMTSSEEYIELPLLYYKGYSAKDITNNAAFNLTKGSNNVLRLIIPANYSGNISVRYTGMWYWKISDIVSLFTLCLIFAHYLYTIFKRKI